MSETKTVQHLQLSSLEVDAVILVLRYVTLR